MSLAPMNVIGMNNNVASDARWASVHQRHSANRLCELSHLEEDKGMAAED